MTAYKTVPLDFKPQTADDWKLALSDPYWRICSGRLYKIMIKGDDGEVKAVLPFAPKKAQLDFLENLHYRNVILKARQLGFTTLIAILWLDHALFVANQRCGIIAHTLHDAEAIFRDKVKFAYENLPLPILARFPLKKETTKEIQFAHNDSAIRVAVSMRSGTINRLHVSEMGKIAKQFPGKATEIVTGSLPAVPINGIAVIESTAEGAEGEFFLIADRAEKLAEQAIMPNMTQFMFHFFPWWQDPQYQMDPSGVIITPEEHEYFSTVQREAGTVLTLRQRAWYISKRENDFSGDADKMRQEMPSTSAECWQKSTAGTFYAPQLSRVRTEGRIGKIPYLEHVRVHTFWDIGAGDGTGIWLMQHVGAQHRFLRYLEGWGEGYAHYVRQLRETGYIFGKHHLPHDADQKRQLEHKVGAPIEMLRKLAPDWDFLIVPRVNDLQHGIDLTRAKFREAWFDAEGCKAGLDHLGLYRKKWNRTVAAFTNEPEKLTGHSEAADAFRQWAQGFTPEQLTSAPRKTRPRRSGMTA